MWSLTRVLVYSSSTAAVGGGLGYGLYEALKKDVEAQKILIDEEFRRGKIKILETKLVDLMKKGQSNYEELAKKVSPKNWNPLLLLNEQKTGFYPEQETQQMEVLNDFCKNTTSKTSVGEEIFKELCE